MFRLLKEKLKQQKKNNYNHLNDFEIYFRKKRFNEKKPPYCKIW